MRKTGLAVPDELQREIRASASAFASEVVGIVLQAVSGFAGQVTPGAGAGAPRVAGARPRATGAGAAKAARGRKESGGAWESSIVAMLKKSKEGVRAETMSKALGTTSAELTKPLQALLAQGRIRRSGQARGTRYHAAG